MAKAELIQKYFPTLTETQLRQFEQLDALYRDWNDKINVISRKDIDNLYEHHVLHSLAIAKIINFRPGTQILDFGTGGGFPGVPLAILFPECQFKLIDGTGKKIRVAQEVSRAIGLKNCNPVQLRGEDEKGKYDFVVSRAVMALPDLEKIVRKNISKTQRNALPNGIICLKGGDLQAETRPFHNIVELTEISEFFSEEWFKEKHVFECNQLQENTYVVSDDTRECVIIDCGAYYDDEFQAIQNYIDTQQLKPVHLLATHGHFDHNFGNDFVFNTYGLKVEISANDAYLINDLPGQFESMIGFPLRRKYPEAGHFFDEGEQIRFGHHTFEILSTPGHTPGGVTFYNQEESIAFTGDTLFRMSIGRTDFDRGSYQEIMDSLQHVIAKLPPDTVAFCGHGPKTTIAEELQYNPYLR